MKDLSVIIPAYNEEESIGPVLAGLEASLSGGGLDYELMVVDDASTDGTAHVAEEATLANPRVRLLSHCRNEGLGGAVMTGVRDSSGRHIMLVPADGQFDPGEIPSFIQALKKNDMVLGVRRDQPGYGLWRKIQSLAYLKLVSFLFDQSYPDVNWVQAWKREVFDSVTPTSRGVFFLQEMAARCRMRGLRTGRVDSVQLPRMGGRAQGCRVGTILLTIWEMIPFRLGDYRAWKARQY
jgi:glycosyltransferase involved in cell wall biosynthesis